MSSDQRSYCVLTRSQFSELPYVESFVDHYMTRLHFDKVLIIYCDTNRVEEFAAFTEAKFGNRVEVLYHPDNTQNVDRSFDRYIARIKDFDYCLNIDMDEYLSIPRSSIAEWIAELGDPRYVAIPWLNLAHFGPPTSSLQDVVLTGLIFPSATLKTISATASLKGLTAHAAEFEVAGTTGPDIAIEWCAGDNEVPGTAEPVSTEILSRARAIIDTLSQRLGEPDTASGLPNSSYQARPAASKVRHETTVASEFSFVVHFNIRGPVDLMLKTAYQNFRAGRAGPNRGGGFAALAPLLREDRFAVAFEDVPSRFRYAFAFKHLMRVAPYVERELRYLLLDRIGNCRIDVALQQSLFTSTLESAGVPEAQATEIWRSDVIGALFHYLDARFGGLFDLDDIAEEREAIFDELARTFDERVNRESVFNVMADWAASRAFLEALKLGLGGPSRFDAVVSQANRTLAESFGLLLDDPHFIKEWPAAIEALEGRLGQLSVVSSKRKGRVTAALVRAFKQATNRNLSGPARIEKAINLAYTQLTERQGSA